MSCCARMWSGKAGGVTGSTKPDSQSSTNPMAWSSDSSLVARKRQLRLVSDRRPVRPIRCKKLETVDGESI